LFFRIKHNPKISLERDIAVFVRGCCNSLSGYASSRRAIPEDSRKVICQETAGVIGVTDDVEVRPTGIRSGLYLHCFLIALRGFVLRAAASPDSSAARSGF
jgi:hypothetical protein